MKNKFCVLKPLEAVETFRRKNRHLKRDKGGFRRFCFNSVKLEVYLQTYFYKP